MSAKISNATITPVAGIATPAKKSNQQQAYHL
jgi:hypothetical protein